MLKLLREKVLRERIDPQRVAVMDLGSNTARLVVMWSIPGYAYRLENEIREVVRLREGMKDGRLSDKAVERGVYTLRMFKSFCDSVGVDIVIPTATSAVRDAVNGPEFVQRIQDEIGWTLNLLSGEKEAYYGVIGVLNEVPMRDGYIVDIGGGSMQISAIHGGKYLQGGSLTLGSLALTDRFVASDPIKNSEMEELIEEIRRQLDTLDWVRPREGWMLAGLGGTIRNLAKIESKRQNYPLNTLHGFILSRKSLAQSIEQFCEMPLKARKQIAGLSSDRADIILAGACVIAEVMDRLEIKELTLSENGLREGVFFEEFWQGQEPPVVADVRKFSVLNMARTYQYEASHVEHVRMLVTRLFDQLVSLHGYGKPEFELLEAAAILHDLGNIIAYSDHHKHSQLLITQAGLAGYSSREQALIALLARYHRKGTPSLDGFEMLMEDGDLKLLTQLSAILRMAEYLERGRSGLVTNIDVLWDDKTMTLSLYSESNPAVEMWDADRNAAPLFEDAFERKVVIECASMPIN